MNLRRPHRAFTLIEMLLAVALTGALLLALNIFIFSMGEIWGQNSEHRLFNQHVRAVTRHVEKLLRTAALVSGQTGGPVTPQEIKRADGATGVLLTFELPAGDRVLPWPGSPLPDVVCSLGTEEGKGLLLYWHSRLELGFETEPPRVLVLTPFGAALSYEYYQSESKTWRSLPDLLREYDGRWLAPDRITLRFAHGELTAVTTVALPVRTDGLPSI